MKFFAAYKFPILLSLVAFVTTFAAMKIADRVFVMVGSLTSTFISVPIAASLCTFVFSALGIYLLTKKNFSPLISALWGFVLGGAAYLCLSTAAIILTLPPSYYDHVFLTLLAIGFILGGFLAPLFGAIIGYWLAKRRIEGQQK